MPSRTPSIALPAARSLAGRLGAGRTALAALVLAAPVPAARLLGADTATAQRVTWLTRMMGVRDGALGVGAMSGARVGDGRGAAGWLIGGAVSDGLDAVVIAGALRQGRVRGFLPIGIVLGASAAAAVGVSTAVRLRRG
jgi:hypothetical protein